MLTLITPLERGFKIKGPKVWVKLSVKWFCQTPVQSPDFSLGTWSWLCFPPSTRITTTTTTRTLRKIYQMEENYRSWIFHMDLTWWKTTFDGSQPLRRKLKKGKQIDGNYENLNIWNNFVKLKPFQMDGQFEGQIWLNSAKWCRIFHLNLPNNS